MMTWICCVAASCPFCSSCLFVSCCAQHDQPQCGQSAAGREGAETHRSSFAIFHHWSCCHTIAGTNPYHYSPSQHAQAHNCRKRRVKTNFTMAAQKLCTIPQSLLSKSSSVATYVPTHVFEHLGTNHCFHKSNFFVNRTLVHAENQISQTPSSNMLP